MKQILADILSSDLLLFSFPLYCYGMPAPLKGLIDRTLPLNSMKMQKNGDRYEHTAQTDYSRLCGRRRTCPPKTERAVVGAQFCGSVFRRH